MCDIIFDQSARSIFAHCQALAFFRLLLIVSILYNKKKITSPHEIRNFSSSVEIFQSFAALSREIFFNTRREISYLFRAAT